MSPAAQEHERVVFFGDRETDLRGITVLHDMTLGPAVGACRSRPYDDEDRALADALRQAQTTTMQAIMAGLPVGGGCTVLMNDRDCGRPGRPYRALGRMVEDLSGRYVLMPDPDDTAHGMDEVAGETSHVLGRSAAGPMDSAEATAIGVGRGIEVAVRNRLGRESLFGLRVAIMGLGPAGFRLAEWLRLRGARLVVADRDPRRTERAVRELGIACVATEEIVHLDTDVFAPCAGKDVIDDDTLAHLRCLIVAGTADDPLLKPEHGRGLHERGILYAPDYVIAAGGLISLVRELGARGGERTALEADLAAIGDRLSELFDKASRAGRPSAELAERMAADRLAKRRQAAERSIVALAC